MNPELLQRWFNRVTNARSRYQKLGRLLMLGSLGYLAVLLAYSGLHLPPIAWRELAVSTGLALILYLISLMLQFLVWLRMLSNYHRVGWTDLKIYSRMILLRRLPGFLWQWLGGAFMYGSHTSLPPSVALRASFWEWLMLLGVALTIFTLFLPADWLVIKTPLIVLEMILLIKLTIYWRHPVYSFGRKVFEGLFWILAYGLSWVVGGIILANFMALVEGQTFRITDAIYIWVVAGGISQLVLIVPAGLGIREVSITWFLSPYLPETVGLFVAVLIRFSFILADLIWGTVGWGVGHLFLRLKKLS